MTQKPATFEESLLRLEDIIKTLDSDKNTLDTTLAGYEEGVTLLRQCHHMLEMAERKIEMLRQPSENAAFDIKTVSESEFCTPTE